MQVGISSVVTTGVAAISRLAAMTILTVFFATVLSLGFSNTAEANSRVCKSLKAQLASVSRGGGRSSSRVQKAIRGQLKQISIAKRRLKQLGCSKRRLFFFRDAHPSCGQMRGALQRMRNNLDALRSRAGASGGAGSKKKRARIRREMRRHQCGVTRKASVSRDQGGSIAEQVFGKKSKNRRKRDAAKQPKSLKTARTVCVRTCDGYFFPVSFSTKKGSASGVANACERLCPGTPMELYYRKSAEQTADDLISLATGQPYSALPNAFAYQKSFNPNCSCNHRQAVETGVVAGEEKKQAKIEIRRAEQAVQKTAMPIWRPDGAADPETAANRRGNLDLAGLGVPAKQRPYDQISQRRVRVVGEAFLPSQ